MNLGCSRNNTQSQQPRRKTFLYGWLHQVNECLQKDDLDIVMAKTTIVVLKKKDKKKMHTSFISLSESERFLCFSQKEKGKAKATKRVHHYKQEIFRVLNAIQGEDKLLMKIISQKANQNLMFVDIMLNDKQTRVMVDIEVTQNFISKQRQSDWAYYCRKV